MKAAKSTTAPKSRGIIFATLLAIILAVLFWKSFLPDYVHFSNDGPLGQQSAKWLHLPEAFIGAWADSNDIGGKAGSFPLGLTALLRWVLGPIGFSKFLPPIALFILGIGAWTFFRQLRLSPLAATLGGLAAALNSTFFASACWGVAPQQIAIGMIFFALALVVSNNQETPWPIRWMRLALAGLAVGINVVEAADIGAIFSLFFSAFVFFRTLMEEGPPIAVKLGRGIVRVAVIATFAGFIAVQTVVSLVGSQITGIAGTGQDTESKAQHWDWATQWSLPKIEALGLFVPGLFGYRMDTPKDMMDSLQESYKGGSYWGAVGSDPAWDRYYANGKQGTPPDPGQHFLRFTGGGNYAGVLVTLVAMWAVAQSLRRRDSVFPDTQRRLIWFWAAVLIFSLLMAFGRFAPFYALLYKLPYFSTIRNPTKFTITFSWGIVVLFAYGIHGMARRYLEGPAGTPNSVPAQLKSWWAKVRGFDRNWTLGSCVIFIGCVLAWLVYAAQKPSLVSYLQTVGFGDDMAKDIAAFSIHQAGWFIILFALAGGLCLLVLAGGFAGRRARLGGILLGVLLVADLGRANLPWIIHWDYKQKYESNAILDFLREKPYEHRVIGLPFRTPSQLSLLGELYRIEWAQHHFPYYGIQSLDVVQRPRMPVDAEAYQMALSPRSPDTYYLMARRWQLTNTRYLLGPAGFMEVLNEQLDPLQHRFRIAQRFEVAPKPGIQQPTRLEELTAVPNDNGNYALFDFTGALPRAKLYANWQTNSLAALNSFTTNGLGEDDLQLLGLVGTNDFLTLKTLAAPAFDPQQTVLLANPLVVPDAGRGTNQNSGSVEFAGYMSKDIVFHTQADAPSVLLLNDAYDPEWKVLVDGRPAPLLRCNFIMRGAPVPAGTHTVEFKYEISNHSLYVSISAIAAGILLCGCLYFWERRQRREAAQP